MALMTSLFSILPLPLPPLAMASYLATSGSPEDTVTLSAPPTARVLPSESLRVPEKVWGTIHAGRGNSVRKGGLPLQSEYDLLGVDIGLAKSVG